MKETDYEKWMRQKEKGMFHYVSRPTIAVMAGICLVRLIWYLSDRIQEYFTVSFMVQMIVVLVLLVGGWSFDWYRNEQDFRDLSKERNEG